MTNEEVFLERYEAELRRALAERPDEYAWPVERVPAVAAKMTRGLALGWSNKDGIAIRRTCAALKIPYTYKGIQGFLREEAP